MKRICNICDIEKSIKDFYKRSNYNKTKTIYYKGSCKDCESKRSFLWRKLNRKKYNQYQNRYQKIKYWAMTSKERSKYNKDRYQKELKNK